MTRHAFSALAAGAAIAIAAPLAAQGQGGGQANAPQGTPAAQDTPDAARANSQGPANASPTGVSNANENSVLSTDPAATAATAKADKPDKKKAEKATSVTVVRAGPNAGQVIGKKRKKADADEAAKPEGDNDPQL